MARLSRLGELFSHWFAFVIAGTALTFVTVSLAAPRLAARLTVAEGPIEHFGHVLLLAVVLTWIVAAGHALRNGAKTTPAARALCVFMPVYLGAILMDEIDWGAVYGWDLGATTVRELTGQPNLHRFLLLPDFDGIALIIWGTPMFGFFALGLAERPKSCVPVRPTFVEGALFYVSCTIGFALNTFPLIELRLGQPVPMIFGYCTRCPAGLFQAVGYALLGVVAVRVIRDLRAE